MVNIESFILCRFFECRGLREDFLNEYSQFNDRFYNNSSIYRLHRFVELGSNGFEQEDYCNALYDELRTYNEECFHDAIRLAVCRQNQINWDENRDEFFYQNDHYESDDSKVSVLKESLMNLEHECAMSNYIIGLYYALMSDRQFFYDRPGIDWPRRSRYYIRKCLKYIDLSKWDCEKSRIFDLSGVEVVADTFFLQAGSIISDDRRSLSVAKELYSHYHLSYLSQSESLSKPLLSFMPYSVYKISDLVNKKITVAHPSKMNDPVDSLLFPWMKNKHDQLDAQLQKAKTKKDKERILSDLEIHKAYEESFNYYRIRSFTEEYSKEGGMTVENALMWSHYADEHRGMAILYDFSNNSFPIRTSKSFIGISKIQYAKLGEVVNIAVPKLSPSVAFLKKSHEWEYENEVRLISYDLDSPGDFQQLSVGTIKAVYFGDRCPESTISTVKTLLSGYNPTIHFFKMELNPLDIYRLNAKKIY